eukprot:gb/GEZJ01005335.1/.p1 GENE.gb/GEZJ01005335.1/~~gb/GEZJ01005335.1/.p1  ORF type:complete len:151 (-),score=17.38 gb/GEZJ01005335.1/:471-923(-)
MNSEKLRHWSQDESLYIFLTFSSDGVEIFKGRKMRRSIWPLMFSILNYSSQFRFQAVNVRLSGFDPGSHDMDKFDFFLSPIFAELQRLEKGLDIYCYDGQTRKVQAFVMFVRADVPAASKLLGIKGHKAESTGRRCHKVARRTLITGNHM